MGFVMSWLRRVRGPVLGVALAAGLGGFVGSESVAEAQSKIAVIDVRRAMLETEEGLRVQATLKKLFDSRQVELDGKQRQLQDGQRVARQGSAERQDLEGSVRAAHRKPAKAGRRAPAIAMDYQREMQRKESEMTMPIYQRILGIVRRIAAQDGFEMILEKSAVPYMRADLEITDRAIQMYNTGQAGDVGGGSKAPPATDGKTPAAKPGADKPAPAPAKPADKPAPAPKK